MMKFFERLLFGGETRRSLATEKTFVQVRGLQIPAKFWTTQVHYDAWGEPYIIGGYYHNHTSHPLRADGKVQETGNVQWRWLSGPEVVWPDRKLPSRGWHPTDVLK
jgi:hypothetical protein